jgi:hypothetical protein
MATMIKRAEKSQKNFEVGDSIKWSIRSHDGRSYETTYYKGTITKVNMINLIVEDEQGNAWKVSKSEVEL